MLWLIWLVLIVIAPTLAGLIIYWQIHSETMAAPLDQAIELTTVPALSAAQPHTSD